MCKGIQLNLSPQLTHYWPWQVRNRQLCDSTHTRSHTRVCKMRRATTCPTEHRRMHGQTQLLTASDLETEEPCMCVFTPTCSTWISSHATQLLSSRLSLCWLTSPSSEWSLMSPSPLAPTRSCYQQLLVRVSKIQEVPLGVRCVWYVLTWTINVHLSPSRSHM